MKENVYLFRHVGTDYVKIGMTKNESVQARFQQFCTYAPNGAEIVGIIKTDNALCLEKELHRKYDSKRCNGEFFLLTDSECEKIVRTYNSDMINKVITEFYSYLSNEDFNMVILYRILKDFNLKKNNSNDVYSNVTKIFKQTDDRKKYMKSSDAFDIYKSIYESNKITPKMFGSVLKKCFGESSSVKIDGISTRVYFIETI